MVAGRVCFPLPAAPSRCISSKHPASTISSTPGTRAHKLIPPSITLQPTATSIFTILEPLLLLQNDSRAKIVIDKFSDLNDHHESKSASTLIEKKRIADLVNQ